MSEALSGGLNWLQFRWFSHGPMHSQQNSYRQPWLRHVMWLHPPFFSIGDWKYVQKINLYWHQLTLHWGHFLECLLIHNIDSLSSFDFLVQSSKRLQVIGSWFSSRSHPMQNDFWHSHLTPKHWVSLIRMARLQSAPGHHLTRSLT